MNIIEALNLDEKLLFAVSRIWIFEIQYWDLNLRLAPHLNKTRAESLIKGLFTWVGLARLSCVMKIFPRPKKIIWINVLPTVKLSQ